MEYLLFSLVVFIPVWFFVNRIKIERERHREWIKQKLSERAKKRDCDVKLLTDIGNTDYVNLYIENSRKIDSIIAMGYDDLSEDVK